MFAFSFSTEFSEYAKTTNQLNNALSKADGRDINIFDANTLTGPPFLIFSCTPELFNIFSINIKTLISLYLIKSFLVHSQQFPSLSVGQSGQDSNYGNFIGAQSLDGVTQSISFLIPVGWFRTADLIPPL